MRSYFPRIFRSTLLSQYSPQHCVHCRFHLSEEKSRPVVRMWALVGAAVSLEWLCGGSACFYSVPAGHHRGIIIKQATIDYLNVLSNFRSYHSTAHKATCHMTCRDFHRTFKFPHPLQPNFNCGPYRRTHLTL